MEKNRRLQLKVEYAKAEKLTQLEREKMLHDNANAQAVHERSLKDKEADIRLQEVKVMDKEADIRLQLAKTEAAKAQVELLRLQLKMRGIGDSE